MEQLGIDPKLIVAQIVNFGLVVFLLHRVLFSRVLKFLDKRKKEIDEGLALTEKMRKEEDALEKKKEKYLDTARREAQQLIADARKRAKDEEKLILEKAHEQSNTVLEKARNEAKEYKKEIEKELKAQVVDVASDMLERLIPEVLSSENQRKLVERQLEKLSKESVRAN